MWFGIIGGIGCYDGVGFIVFCYDVDDLYLLLNN